MKKLIEHAKRSAFEQLSSTTCISLKQLYETGRKSLRYGGNIEFTMEDGNEFYDLYQDGAEHNLLLCDGEKVCVAQKFSDVIIMENPDTGRRIWLSAEEFDIASFS